MENLAAYSHLIRVERAAVLDVGCSFTKCGLAGKYAPRHIVPTRFITAKGKEITLRDASKGSEQEWKEALEVFLREIFLVRMGIGKGYNLVVLDSLIHPLPFRKALIYVILNRFRFSSVKYLVAECTSLFAIRPNSDSLLFQTGLVVDIGSQDSRVLPIYDGIALIGKLQQGGASSFDVLQRLRALLLEHGVVKTTEGTVKEMKETALTETVLRDILTRCCFSCLRAYSSGEQPLLKFPPKDTTCFDILSLRQGQQESKEQEKKQKSFSALRSEENKRIASVTCPLPDGTILTVDGFTRGHCTDVLFENTEDFPSIAAKILDALLACELDMRSELAFSIVISGGICSISGLLTRVLEECELLFRTDKYASISSLSGKLNLYSSPYNPITLPWVGASVIGSLQESGITVTAEEFKEKSFACLPNWNSKVIL